jgi:hypothetical protein
MLQPKSMRKQLFNLLRLLLLIATGIIGARTAMAVDLLVYTNSDSGAGSLRQAIADNASLGGGNNIVFSNSVMSPIVLSNELLISNNVAIVGPGDKVLTVSGNNAVRVFHITSNITATVWGLTMANGRDGRNGGAVLQESGLLTLAGCTITGSVASNSASGGGGGMEVDGSVLASNCTFSSNTAGPAGVGGAIYQPAIGSNTMQLLNCTFFQNHAGYAGGGVYYGGSQGLMRNCTFAGNESLFGGGLFNAGGLAIMSCTISGNSAANGGGIMNDATLSVQNTIVAGNTASVSGPDCYNAFTSSGFNLIGISDGSTGWGATGDQVGTAANPIDPKLGPLQDNGGPTMTMALLLGSPCIDQGDSGGITNDQRGEVRPFDFPLIPNAIGGDGSDIGAFELRSILVYNNNDSGAGSLRQAIADNATFGGGNDIVFSNRIASPITLASELLISNSVSIIGPGDKALTVSGNNATRVFHLTNNPTVSISGLTIANGSNSSRGGGIFQDSGSLDLSGCTITSNHSTGSFSSAGGGIFVAGGSIAASNCTFSTNSSKAGGGGAIIVGGGAQAMQLDNCTFSQNSLGSAGAGGAIVFLAPQGMIRNCTFANNQASGGGGGIFNQGGLTILNSTFSGNTSTSFTGGGIDNAGSGTVAIRNTIVARNTASTGGPDCAGIFTTSGDNFIGVSDGSTGWGEGGDQIGTSTNPINPLLGPLQDNGGPTMTMALLPGSPCIDQGDSGGITTDQRGAVRPFAFPLIPNLSGGDRSDIGAYELGLPLLSIQQVAGNTVVSWPFSYGGFRLQSETDLTSGGWTNALGTQVVAGNRFTVTNGPVTGNTFYRLTSP